MSEQVIEQLLNVDIETLESMTLKLLKDASQEMKSTPLLREELLINIQTLVKKQLKRSLNALKKQKVHLTVDCNVSVELKDFLCSFRQLVRQRFFNGVFYEFHYTPEFIAYFELRRRESIKEKARERVRIRKLAESEKEEKDE